MRILVAGSSGLIGTALVPALRAGGHEVRRLVRRSPTSADEVGWDPPAGHVDEHAFDGAGAVVNLCGAGIGERRWTHARKQILVDSRTEPTEVLAGAVAEHGIATMLNASAVGYYGHTGSRTVEESAPAGADFLARLCVDWESATAAAAAAGARVVALRSGLVLAGSGGLFPLLRRVFRLGLGGTLGSGAQYMPWISIVDEAAAIRFVLEHADIGGPINLTAPLPVTNAEFTRTLGNVLGRPAPWRVPRIALRAALGEFADVVALAGQRAVPTALTDAGFEFTHQALPGALRAALSP